MSKNRDYYGLKEEKAKYYNVGKNKDFRSYSQWKNHVIKKYGKSALIQLENMAGYIRREKRALQIRLDNFTSLSLPILLTVIALAIAVCPYAYTVFRDIDKLSFDFHNYDIERNKDIDDIEKDKMTMENFNSSLNDLRESFNIVMTAFLVLLGLCSFMLGFVVFFSKAMKEKINYYKDYLIVIQELIEEKHKSESQ